MKIQLKTKTVQETVQEIEIETPCFRMSSSGAYVAAIISETKSIEVCKQQQIDVFDFISTQLFFTEESKEITREEFMEAYNIAQQNIFEAMKEL